MGYVRFSDPDGNRRSGEMTNGSITADGKTFDSDAVEFLPPVKPTKIVCAASNYRGGFSEPSEYPDEPILFVKTPNALSAHRQTVTLPAAEDVFFEGELAVVIGEHCSDVDTSDAMSVVEGYTCANDLSDRTVENMVRRKAFDGAAPVGPAVVSPENVSSESTIETRINGETFQSSTLSELVFSVPELIADISQFQTLEPGDVILTGSPPGMAPLSDGDEFEVEIEGIGTLTHDVSL